MCQQVSLDGGNIQARGSQLHVETSFCNGGKEASFRLNLEVAVGGAIGSSSFSLPIFVIGNGAAAPASSVEAFCQAPGGATTTNLQCLWLQVVAQATLVAAGFSRENQKTTWSTSDGSYGYQTKSELWTNWITELYGSYVFTCLAERPLKR